MVLRGDPPFTVPHTEKDAEHLFVEMAGRTVPSEYRDVFLMIEYGWTEQEVQAMSIETRKRIDTYLYDSARLREGK